MPPAARRRSIDLCLAGVQTLGALAALTTACVPPRAPPASFVNRVWQVDSSPQIAGGELRVFLSEGTLVMASEHGTPAFGRWRATGDRRLTITEEGRDYDTEILELTSDVFHIVIHGPGTPVDIRFRPADIVLPKVSSSAQPKPAVSDLLGTWTITGHRNPGVSAMSDAEAKRWQGRTIRLAAHEAVSDSSRCDHPVYAERTVAWDSVRREFKLAPGVIPALDSAGRLRLLEVSCGSGLWDAAGNRLFAPAADRAVTVWEGVFFWVRKAKG